MHRFIIVFTLLLFSYIPSAMAQDAAPLSAGQWLMLDIGGGQHTCGIKTDGTAWCWGAGTNGQRGDALTSGVQSAPSFPVKGEGGWKDISIGMTHSCGIKDDGSAWCWGGGGNGQRGDGVASATQAMPVRATESGLWIDIAAGGNHTCAVKQDGTAWCWGAGPNGQRGDNAPSAARTSPAKVVAEGAWKSITAGGHHSCGIKTDGTAWCWGVSNAGQRGDGAPSQLQATPVAVAGGGAWSLLSAGAFHTCGIKTDGTAWCWGFGKFGELGNGDTKPKAAPVPVSGGGQWIAITASKGITDVAHSCGVKSDGTAWCWGHGGYGQRGDASVSVQRPAPVAVADPGPWSVLTAGTIYTCGIKKDGTAWCWGDGASGKRGDGSTSTARARPAPVMPTGSVSGQ